MSVREKLFDDLSKSTSIRPFEAHISSEGVESGVNQSNVHKIYLGYEKPQKGVVVKFKLPNGEKKYIRGE